MYKYCILFYIPPVAGHVDVNQRALDGTSPAELLIHSTSKDPFSSNVNPVSKETMVAILPKTRKGLNPELFFRIG
jgi:hypothetical protein